MTRLDLKTKLELIEHHLKNGLKVHKSASKYGVSLGTARTIITNKRSLVQRYNKTVKDGRAKKFPCTERAVAENELSKWHREIETSQQRSSPGVTLLQVKKQLKGVVRAYALQCCRTSEWVNGFIQKYGVVVKRPQPKTDLSRSQSLKNDPQSSKVNESNLSENGEVGVKGALIPVELESGAGNPLNLNLLVPKPWPKLINCCSPGIGNGGFTGVVGVSNVPLQNNCENFTIDPGKKTDNAEGDPKEINALLPGKLILKTDNLSEDNKNFPEEVGVNNALIPQDLKNSGAKTKKINPFASKNCRFKRRGFGDDADCGAAKPKKTLVSKKPKFKPANLNKDNRGFSGEVEEEHVLIPQVLTSGAAKPSEINLFPTKKHKFKTNSLSDISEGSNALYPKKTKLLGSKKLKFQSSNLNENYKGFPGANDVLISVNHERFSSNSESGAAITKKSLGEVAKSIPKVVGAKDALILESCNGFLGDSQNDNQKNNPIISKKLESKNDRNGAFNLPKTNLLVSKHLRSAITTQTPGNDKDFSKKSENLPNGALSITTINPTTINPTTSKHSRFDSSGGGESEHFSFGTGEIQQTIPDSNLPSSRKLKLSFATKLGRAKKREPKEQRLKKNPLSFQHHKKPKIQISRSVYSNHSQKSPLDMVDPVERPVNMESNNNVEAQKKIKRHRRNNLEMLLHARSEFCSHQMTEEQEETTASNAPTEMLINAPFNPFGKKTRKTRRRRRIYFTERPQLLKAKKTGIKRNKVEPSGRAQMAINPSSRNGEFGTTSGSANCSANSGTQPKENEEQKTAVSKVLLENSEKNSMDLAIKPVGKKTRKRRIYFATKSTFLRPRKPIYPEVNEATSGLIGSGSKSQLKEKQEETTGSNISTEILIDHFVQKTRKTCRRRRIYFTKRPKLLKAKSPGVKENKVKSSGRAQMTINPSGRNGEFGMINRSPGKRDNLEVSEATPGPSPGSINSGAKAQLTGKQEETTAPKAPTEMSMKASGQKTRKTRRRRKMYFTTKPKILRPRNAKNPEINNPEPIMSGIISQQEDNKGDPAGTAQIAINLSGGNGELGIIKRPERPENQEMNETTPGSSPGSIHSEAKLKGKQADSTIPTEMFINPFVQKIRKCRGKKRIYFTTQPKLLRPRKPKNPGINEKTPEHIASSNISQQKENKGELAGTAQMAIKPSGQNGKCGVIKRPGRPKNREMNGATHGPSPGSINSGAEPQLTGKQETTAPKAPTEMSINPFGQKIRRRRRKRRIYYTSKPKLLRPRKPEINKETPEPIALENKFQQKGNKVESAGTAQLAINPFCRNGEFVMKRRPGRPKNSAVNKAMPEGGTKSTDLHTKHQQQTAVLRGIEMAINPFAKKTRTRGNYLVTKSMFLRPRKPKTLQDTPKEAISINKSQQEENKVKHIGTTQMAINPFGRSTNGEFQIIKRRSGRPKKIQNSGAPLDHSEKSSHMAQEVSIDPEMPILECIHKQQTCKLPELSICLRRAELLKQDKKVFYLNQARRKRGRPAKFLQYLDKKIPKSSLEEPVMANEIPGMSQNSDTIPEQSLVEVLGPNGPLMAKLYKPDFETYLPEEIIDIGECWKRKRKRKRRSYEKNDWKGESTSEQEDEDEPPKRRRLRRRMLLDMIKSEPEGFEAEDLESPPELSLEAGEYYQIIEDKDTVELVCPEKPKSRSRIEILSNIQIVSGLEELPNLDVSWSNLFPDLEHPEPPDEPNDVNEIQYDPDVFKNVKIEVVSSVLTDEENEMNDGAEGDDEWEDDDAPITSQPQPMPPPNQIPQPPNSMQGGYRPPMPPNARAPAPRGPQPGASRMPGGPRGPNLINQRAPGMRPRAPMIRPRGAGSQHLRGGGQMRPRMSGPPQNVRGGVTSPLKRHPGPPQGLNNANVKRKRVDVLTPSDKDDDDCQVICMQPKNTGLPQIESVQGAESVENSIMKLSDSITLTSVRPQPKPSAVSPQKSETAKAVANVLASRGITVTSSGKGTKDASPTKQAPALPAGINLNGSISIVTKTSSGDALPTVDLTDEVSGPAPNSPNKMRAGLPYRCDLCPATYPNALGLNKHRQTYHKTNSGMCELGVPLVNLKTPGIMQKLSQVGINNYIPLQAATPEGTYAIPLINTKSPGNVAALGATQMLTLGPVRPISRPSNNVNSPTKKL